MVAGLVVCSQCAVQAHDGIHARLARLDTAIAEQPGQAELLVRRADLHRRHGDATRAWADLRRAGALPGGAAEGRPVEALLARDLGWLHLARRTIAAHLAAQPGDGDGHVLHAELLASLGRSTASLAAYRRALAIQPAPGPELFLAAAATLKSRGDAGREAALTLIAEGLARLGPQVALQLEAVTLEVALGRLDDALGRLTELSRASSRPERWLAQRGDLLWEADRRDEARAAYLDAQRAQGDGGRRRSHTAAATALRQHISDRLTATTTPSTTTSSLSPTPAKTNTPSGTRSRPQPDTEDGLP